MIGGNQRRSSSLHFASRRPRRRFPLRAVVAVLILLVIAFGALCVAASAEAPPLLKLTRALPASARLPGPPPQLAWPATGEAAVSVDGIGTLGTSGTTDPVPIASLAKIMTAYVVLKDHPVAPGQNGYSVTITPEQVADFEQRAGSAQSVVAVASGETISELQLLQGLLVASGNNLAFILAAQNSGTTDAFVARMNAEAKAAGMAHTTYTDPSGLASTTVSTASDQMLLASKAMSDPVFASIVAMPAVTLPVAGTLSNFDKAVGQGGFVGVKTGSDAMAGGCIVFVNRRTIEGHPVSVVGAVLGQDQGVQSTRALLAAAQAAVSALVTSTVNSLTVRVAVPAGTPVATLMNGPGRKVSLITASPLSVLGYGGETVPVAVQLSAPGRTVRQAQVGGSVSVGTERVDVKAASTMPAVPFSWRLEHVL